MNINDLVLKNRSYRRFHQSESIDTNTLKDLVNLARLSASAANRQPLKFILSNEKEKNDRIFSCLAWAAYLREWSGPDEGERPSAYIIILLDTGIIKTMEYPDHGIAAQTILLGAVEKGLGGCMLAAIRKAELAKLLGIPEEYAILLVIALGKPKEKVVIDAVGPGGDIKYWRDKDLVHHVPKRSLDDIILKL